VALGTAEGGRAVAHRQRHEGQQQKRQSYPLQGSIR